MDDKPSVEITERMQAEQARNEAYDIIRKSPAVAFLWKNDQGWPVEYVTDNVKTVFGYTAEDLVSGRVPYDQIVHPDDLERVAREVSSFSQEEGREAFVHEPYRIVTKDGRVRWLDDRTYIRRDETGRITHYQGIVLDITERKQAEGALIRQEAELRATLYSIGDAVIATDIEGRVVRMNPVAEQLTGWTEAEAVGRPLQEVFNIVYEGTRRQVENPVARVLREGAVVGLANHTLLIACDGREVPIADAGSPIRDDEGKATGVVLVFRDQTEERLAQRLMKTRLSLIEYAASHALDELLTRALDEVGTFVDSPIGFYHFVEPDQTIHNDYASLPHRKGMPKGHVEVIRELVVPVMREDKVVAILGVGNKPTKYTQKDVEIVSYLADVTWELVRRKRAEEALRESENRYRQLFEAESDAVFMIENQTGRIIEANSAASAMYGYSRQELLTKKNTDLSAEPEDTRRVTQTSPVVPDLVVNIPFRLHRKKDGTVFPVEITGRFFVWQGRPVHIAAIRDITERQQAEEQLQASLREKEALLKEIHHRVKNNLQVVSSLLALQADSVTDPQVHQMFQDNLSRIRAMGLIHERLYRAKDLASINAPDYVRDLVAHLFNIYANPVRVVRSHVRVDDLTLGIDMAIPCGLLLTELVSNALKHAFPPEWEREGRIDVELRAADEGRLILVVSNNGVRLSPDFDLKQVQSLGLQLVNLLASQIKGTVELDRSEGTTFCVTFPHAGHQP